MIHTLTAASPVIVQGITTLAGRAQAALMRAYGTNIVGGTCARAGVADIDGLPVFPDASAAVLDTSAVASVLFTPPLETVGAVEEALAAGIRLVVTPLGGVPSHDAIRIGRTIRRAGASWIGANTPGFAIPAQRVKLGVLPDVCLRPGPLGIMTRSASLSYEIGYRLSRIGIGQSLWVGVGADAVKGMRFADLVTIFLDDPETETIVLVGAADGTDEEECAETWERQGGWKPFHALVPRAPASKITRLRRAGIKVHATLDDLVRACAGNVTPFRR